MYYSLVAQNVWVEAVLSCAFCSGYNSEKFYRMEPSKTIDTAMVEVGKLTTF